MDRTKEIDLKEIAIAIWHKLWLVVLCAAIVGAAVFAITVNFIQPQYRASVSIYVNNTTQPQGSTGITAANLSASQRLVTTYITILKSDTVLEKVAQEAGGNVSVSAIRRMMTAQSLEETEVFQVSISHANPQTAADIANAIAAVAPEEISYFVDGSSTKIIDYAKVPTAPYSPNIMQNTALGVCAGILLAVVTIILQVVLDVRIKDEADLEQISAAPVLGVIPSFALGQKSEYAYELEMNSKAVKK